MRKGPSIADALRGIARVTAEEDGEQGPAYAELPEPAVDAEVVEGNALLARLVPSSGGSAFTHFADGSQYSRAAFYEGSLPGRYAFLNAGVAVRVDREILHLEEEVFSEGLFAPWGHAVVRLQEAFGGELGVHAVEVLPEDGMMRMAQRVADAVSAERGRLELAACRAWLATRIDGVLLVDGSIAQLVSDSRDMPVGSVVGVVKSHRKQYFTRATAATILGLREGERSSVFVVRSRRDQDEPTHSWYLRLREDDSRNPAFGIVRLEVPPSDDSGNLADEVSAWVLHERSPLSMPDVRYDRLVYPIRVVEQLLKSQHPSRHAVQSLIGL